MTAQERSASLTVTVGVDPSTLRVIVSAPVVSVTAGQTLTIRWTSSDPVELLFVGFDNPTGAEAPITIPEETGGDWKATVDNLEPGQYVSYFYYSVYVRYTDAAGNAMVLCTDPEIKNEPKPPTGT